MNQMTLHPDAPEHGGDAAREKYRLGTLARQNIVGMAECDRVGRLTYVNQRYCDILGYSEAALLGMNIEHVTHAEDWPPHAEMLRTVSGTVACCECEKRYVRADGAIIWLWMTLATNQDDEGRTVGYVLLVLDISVRKQHEQESRNRQQAMAASQSIAPIGTWTCEWVDDHAVDPDKRLQLSEEACQILDLDRHPHYRLTDLLGHIHADDRDQLMHWFRHSCDHSDVEEVIVRRVLPDHRLQWLSVRRKRVCDDTQPRLRLVGTVQDVTVRQDLIELIRETRHRFRDMFDHLPIAYQSLDIQGRWLDANQPMANLLGFADAREMQGLEFMDFWVDVDRESNPTAYDALQKKLCEEGAVTLRRRDGGFVTAILSGVIERDPEGNFVRTHCVLHDITQREKLSQAALVRSEERYRGIVETAQEGIWIVNDTSCIVFTNSKLATLLGYSVHEMLGQCYLDFISPDSLAPAIAHQQALMSGQSAQQEYKLRAKSGGIVWAVISGSPLYRDDGVYTGALGMITDITSQKLLQMEVQDYLERLQESDRSKDRFLAVLSHELRNPLAPIGIALHLLNDASLDAARLHQCTDIIRRQYAQLTRLIDDMLDMSRITQGKIELRMTRLALNEVINQAVETSHPIINEKNHELELGRLPETIWLNGDLQRLTQAIANLLINAAKFTPPGGKIEVGLETTPTQIRISVKDNGIGITLQQIHRIFQLFGQANESPTDRCGGLGIGLNLAQAIVQMHGGTLEAFSEGEGKGSQFVVTLPRIEDLSAEDSAPTTPEFAATGLSRSILVIDDNIDASISLSMLLERLGHVVKTAHDGQTGMSLAETLRPDLIFLDLGMPGMNGYEVCQAIRGEPWGKSIRIVALTGWGHARDRAQTLQMGFDEHITKPATLKDIQWVISNVKPGQDRVDDGCTSP